MRGLMLRDHLCQGEERYPLLVDGVSVEFSLAPNGIKVISHTFHMLFESYENSWGTMGISQPGPFAAKETFFLSSSHALQSPTLH